MSEPSSASTELSSTSATRQATTTKRPPTLDDIAARLKLDGKAPAAPKEPLAASAGSTTDTGRPRLGLTGRLNSNADPTAASGLPTGASGTDLPEAAPSTDIHTRAKGGLPSLDDIRQHMNKRHFADATSKLEVTSEQQDGESAATRAKKGTGADVKVTPSGLDDSASQISTQEPVVPQKEADVEKDVSAQDQAKDALPSASSTPAHHPLQHQWTLYFDSKTWNPSTAAQTAPTSDANDLSQPSSATSVKAAASLPDGYEATLKKLGAYKTVESFMATFATLRRPAQLEQGSNYHFFKDGIKPMWEDPANAAGGKWTVLLRGTNPELLNRSWTWLVLALIGEELDEADDITGAVCSLRPKGDRITLWVRNKEDVERVNRIGRRLSHLLKIENEPGVSLDFSSHEGVQTYGGRNALPSKFISFQNKEPSRRTNEGGGGSRFSSPARAPGGSGVLGGPIGRSTPKTSGETSSAVNGRSSESRFAKAAPDGAAAAGTQ